MSSSSLASFQADGSTDAGNIEDELFLVLYLDYHSKKGKVCVVNSFFTVRQLESGTGRGLFDCFMNALQGEKDPANAWLARALLGTTRLCAAVCEIITVLRLVTLVMT